MFRATQVTAVNSSEVQHNEFYGFAIYLVSFVMFGTKTDNVLGPFDFWHCLL